MTDLRPCWIDYETQSACDLKKCGSYVYAQHPSTRVICAAILYNEHRIFWTMDPYQLWMPPGVNYEHGYQFLWDLFHEPTIMIAHNVDFERPISEFTLKLPPPPGGWRDTMDQTLMRGLPAGADAAGSYLLGMGKDIDGYKHMMATCRPKRDGTMPELTVEVMQKYVRYNFRDVDIQKGITDLFGWEIQPQREAEVNRLHRDINHRGVQLDVQFAETLRDFDDSFKAEARKQTESATNGEVKGEDLTRRDFILNWLRCKGLHMDKLDADHIEKVLEADQEGEIELPADIYAVLTNRLVVSRAALSKVETALRGACTDGRLYALLKYWGARTGRWCVAKGTLVLVLRHKIPSWLPIERVSLGDMVWDGSKWVSHDGAVYKGEKSVLHYQGLTATPDHVLYLNERDTCRFRDLADRKAEPWRGASLPTDFPGWPALHRHNHHDAEMSIVGAREPKYQAQATPDWAGVPKIYSIPGQNYYSSPMPVYRRGATVGNKGDSGPRYANTQRVQCDPRWRLGRIRWEQALVGYASSQSGLGPRIPSFFERGGAGFTEVKGALAYFEPEAARVVSEQQGKGDSTKHRERKAGNKENSRIARDGVEARSSRLDGSREDCELEAVEEGMGGAPRMEESRVGAEQESCCQSVGSNDTGTKSRSLSRYIRRAEKRFCEVDQKCQSQTIGTTGPGSEEHRSHIKEETAKRSPRGLLDTRTTGGVQSKKKKASVYDLLNVGDKNRFLTEAGVVSNCGMRIQVQNMKRPNEAFNEDSAKHFESVGMTGVGVPGMSLLQLAIKAVETKDRALFEKCTAGLPPYELLSSLVRAIFIPSPGHKFIVGDFAQVEARGLLWWAEDWEGLKEHLDYDAGLGPDVYCTFASTIYRKTVMKKEHPKERQAGKVGQLACLAEGTLVLTDKGWKQIEHVVLSDLIWDGIDWVKHEGVIERGYKTCYSFSGVWMTEDHRVFFSPYSEAAEAGDIRRGFIHRTSAALYGHECLTKAGAAAGPLRGMKLAHSELPEYRKTYDIVNAGPRHRFLVGAEAYGGQYLLVHNCGYQGSVGAVRRMAYANGIDLAAAGVDEITVVNAWRTKYPRVVDLWYQCDAAFRRAIMVPNKEFRVGVCTFTGFPGRVEMRLPSGRVLTYMNARLEPSMKAGFEHTTIIAYDSAVKGFVKREEIYGGKIVENGVQAICRDLLADAMLRVDEQGDNIVFHIHDELVVEAPDDLAEEVRDSVEQIMKTPPEWAKGFPLNAEPEIVERYGK